MLKVMIVDDEPFIAQGLQVLINWKRQNFEIVKRDRSCHNRYQDAYYERRGAPSEGEGRKSL